MKPPKPTKDADQAKAFRKAARELGADESEEKFQGVLRKLATRSLKPKKPEKKIEDRD